MSKKIEFNFVGTNPSKLNVGDRLKVTSYWKDANTSNTWNTVRSLSYEVKIYEINKINENCYLLKCIRHWDYIDKDSKERIRVNIKGQSNSIYCDSQKGYSTKKVVTLI